jgi:hypothetical protein
MVDCDDSNWPMAIVVAEDAVSLADHRRFLQQWTSWLNRAQPFVLLRIFVCNDAMREPIAASRESRNWLAANAARVRSFMPAIAMSVPAGQSIASDSGDFYASLGVPTRWFEDSKAAVAWLQQDILAPIGMVINNL